MKRLSALPAGALCGLLAWATVVSGGPAVVATVPPPEKVSFRNHVIPVLTKMGCNSGSCHGAASGKNGFKLTLRGYDPELDYLTLTRQAAGRRTDPLEPAASLLLLKPTRSIPHMGGKRFEVGSPEYQALAGWIAAGMAPPREDDARLTRIDVAPARRAMRAGEEFQIAVRAHFSDGRIEDVTRWARYTSADETVARVGDTGLVRAQASGDTAVNVAYMTRVGASRVTVPYVQDVDAGAFARAQRNNFIDDLVLAKLRELNIPPSGPCTDAEFIRRAYVDAAGILPSPDEVASFLADTAPDKRSRLIDGLLRRPEFVDYWAYKWSDVLLVSTRKLSRKSAESFYGWIREAVQRNTPWDRFASELTAARGRSDENGAVNYFLIHRSPIELAENYTQAFLGLTLTCARCHNHPLEKWTQKDYYGFANLFARVAHKTDGGAMVVYSAAGGDLPLGQGSSSPRVGRPLPPRPLDGVAMPEGASQDRREYLARWLTAPGNPLFARTAVNRVWANFLGRGLVHPADDMRSTNPAANPELLAALTKDFVARGHDVKALIRTIMTSATYQRSSETTPQNAMDDRFGSHYLPRRLPAEVLLDALSQVTAVPQAFSGYPAGTRALQLPDTRVKSYFLTAFGRPERAATTTAERQQDPTLAQALHVINGDTLNAKLKDDDGALARLIARGAADEEIVRRLYVAALAREPTAGEREALLASLAESAKDPAARRGALEDVAWAVLTSKEFVFNH